MTPIVYVLVLNWNGYPDTLRCLKSLQNLNYKSTRVVVIDNASTDDSVNLIKAAYPEDIKVIVNQDNLGFAGGNNEGIKYALEKEAEYFWLLNNDTQVDPEALTEMVKALEQDTSIGMAGSRIYHMDQRDKLLFDGGSINWLTGRCSHQTDKSDYVEPREVDFITGCSLLVRRQVIEKVGMLDDRFFLYYEDTDWSVRVKKAGYRLVCVPTSIVYHDESSTVGKASATQQYYCTRNNLLFMRKHGRWYQWFTFIPFFSAKVLAKAILFSGFGQPGLIRSLVKGVADLVRGRLGRQEVR